MNRIYYLICVLKTYMVGYNIVQKLALLIECYVFRFICDEHGDPFHCLHSEFQHIHIRDFIYPLLC